MLPVCKRISRRGTENNLSSHMLHKIIYFPLGNKFPICFRYLSFLFVGFDRVQDTKGIEMDTNN